MDLLNLSVSKYDYLNQLAGSKIDHININKCFSKYFDVKVHNLSEGEYLTKEDFVNRFLGRCSYHLSRIIILLSYSTFQGMVI